MKKKIILCIVCFFVVIIMYTAYFNILENTVVGDAIQFVIPPGKMTMSRYFRRDQKDLQIIVDFFQNSAYSEIYITRVSYADEPEVMFTGYLTGNVKIEDDTVIDAIERLFTKWKYDVIERSGNTISFQKWSNLDKGRGIAYSINGEDDPQLDFLTDLKALSKKGWYYYEEDYNEWRIQHEKSLNS